MSVHTAKSSLVSILKNSMPVAERERIKNSIINKVRFKEPDRPSLAMVVSTAKEHRNFEPMKELAEILRGVTLEEKDFLPLFTDAREVAHLLNSKYSVIVESLLSVSWIKRSPEAVKLYADFCIDIVVAHSSYVPLAINNLIALWIPHDGDAADWVDGRPSEKIRNELEAVHKLLDRILSAIPMAFDDIVETTKKLFPYYKKPEFVIVGYLHNVLWLLEYRPIFLKVTLQLIFQKLIVLDVNAPRNELEETEVYEDDDGEENTFQMEGFAKDFEDNTPMQHPIGQTLDVCMNKMFSFLDSKNIYSQITKAESKPQLLAEALKFRNILFASFDETILRSHNTHHVQFVMFYYCSFNHAIAEAFLTSLWEKVCNPNVSAVIRQTAVSYMASFLARSKHLSIPTLKHYLEVLCIWAHQYIQRCDQYRSNGSLKANLVFFTICQTIFYVIAFRIRDLMSNKKGLLFLQSLQLSAIVTCNFNPLRVCLSSVVTAFASITRAYQLAYCHAIIERNARRKLATVYANDVATPEEVLETFFPFDPYLLKSSGKQITPLFLQYQAADLEDHASDDKDFVDRRRKRRDSDNRNAMDVDDFLLYDKRQRIADLARSQEREAKFTYGASPGFYT